MYREVGENARKGFNLSLTVDGWVACTQLRLTDTFMRKSFEDGRFKQFSELSPNKRKEIAGNIRDRVDDLLVKAEAEKKAKVDKCKKAVLNKVTRIKETQKQLREIDSKVSDVLKRAYPILTQGLGWTNPDIREEEIMISQFQVH